MSGPDWAFLAVELVYFALAIFAGCTFRQDMRWLSNTWFAVSILPLVLLGVGLSR